MSTERERDEDKKDKKSLAELLAGYFEDLIAKIKELLGKEKDKGLSREEQEELHQLREEGQHRLEQFGQTAFGKQIFELQKDINQKLERALERLRRSSPAEFQDRAREVSSLIGGQKNVAEQLIRGEPKNIGEKLEGIAKHELEEAIGLREKDYREAILQNQQAASTDRPQRQSRGQRGALEEQLGQVEQIGKDLNWTDEQIENAKKQVIASGGRSYFPIDQMMLMEDADRGAEAREQAFNEILGVVDSNPALRFYEALDLETSTKLAQFRLYLTKIEGEKGHRVIQEYMSKMKMRMMLHDAVWVVEQGAGKPEDFQKMMEMFTPELFDQLFKYEGVEMAAHLYEQGLEMVRSRNDNFPPYEYLVSNPKEGNRCFLDDWVKARLEEIMKAKEGANYKWKERDIRRVMALGKGYEMATLRMQEMVARGRLPSYRPPAELQSPYAEDFVRPLDPFEHLIEKFMQGDPGAMWLMYTVSDGAIVPGSSRAEIDHLFQQTGVNPNTLRMIDIVNFLHIGGPFSSSGWRGAIAMEDLPDETKAKWMGLAFRLAQAKALAEKEGISEAEMKRKIFEEELQRNPLRILREAELQDGEILNLDIQANILEETLKQLYSGAELEQKIEELAAVRKGNESDKDFADRIRKAKNARTIFLDKAESPLVFLTQIEADKDMGRKGKIDFSRLSVDQKKYAEAYFKAVDTVVHDEGRWINKEGHKKSLLDYLAQKEFPFAPGLDDTPWSELKFIKMGQKGFARRMRDYKEAYGAMMGMLKLQNSFGMMHKAEDYIKVVDEVWQAFRGYDKDLAKKKVEKIYEGICKFNSGNWARRWLPWPLSDFVDEPTQLPFVGDLFKNSSYAREAFGHFANSWQAVDVRNFLFKVREAGHINKEQEHELRKKLHCAGGYIIAEYVARHWVFAPFLIGVTFFKELLEQLQEQIKES
jgi:hypothetical protein